MFQQEILDKYPISRLIEQYFEKIRTENRLIKTDFSTKMALFCQLDYCL